MTEELDEDGNMIYTLVETVSNEDHGTIIINAQGSSLLTTWHEDGDGNV